MLALICPFTYARLYIQLALSGQLYAETGE
jgi:hypothetical protein